MDILTSTLSLITNLQNSIQEINNNLILLENTINLKNNLISTLENTIKMLNEQLSEKTSDLEGFSKVSILISTNKELQVKNNYIKILESQLSKLKNKNNNKEEIDIKKFIQEEEKYIKTEIIKEDIKEEIKTETIK